MSNLRLSQYLALLLLSGCASVATQRLAGQLSDAMLNQSDPEIVRSGAPAYLLLLDSLIAEQPDDTSLLLAGARLYGAYATGMVEAEAVERRQLLTAKALGYAGRAFCARRPTICEARGKTFPTFAATLDETGRRDLPAMYVFATRWIDWIQARSDDWQAVAELPKAEQVLRRVVALDPAFDNGRAQLYLAALLALRPPALGGDPQQARRHFQLALRYSGGKDLMIKVEFARRYARMVFNRTLHDRLLREVLEANPRQPGLTLSNVLAQREARKLLAEDYF